LAGALILAEVLICVLNTRASAMETTPAKTMNDLFVVFSLSVLAQVYTAAYARICGSRTFRQNECVIYLIAIVAIGTATPF